LTKRIKNRKQTALADMAYKSLNISFTLMLKYRVNEEWSERNNTK